MRINTFLLILLFKYTNAFTNKMLSKHFTKSHLRQYLSKASQDHYKQKSLAPLYKPKTTNQHKYVSELNNHTTSIVIGVGPAGCGKTLFACITAIDQLKRNKIDKIVLTRPIVPVEEEELGFLPGSIINKMDPWTRPIFDILLEFYPQQELTMMLKNNIIEVSPLAYMRGRTFKNSFIIADEMQNSTPNQMLMLTTRLGKNSKMVITGDLKQSDKNENNGLKDLMMKLKKPQNQNITEISLIELHETDVERSEIVKTILNIYHDKQPTDSKNQKLQTYMYDFINKQTPPDNDAAIIPKSHHKDL